MLRPSSLLVVLLAACSSSSTTSTTPPPERTDLIKRGDGPLTLVGKTLDVGDAMPAVALADGKLQKIDLGALKGKLVILSVVPSIDTRVCETQTHRVNDAMSLFPAGAEVMTVSRDLPFAQTRFAEEAVIRTKMGSDYHGGAFGKAFGLEVKETGLLARSVWVIAPDGKIAYREIVADQGTEPNYDALVEAAKKASGGG
ncbi:MAG TPA: thiol peroxidase [Kofleriaceae bacterium]|nr:thiol peroxidase [Kofleriaceae bacterium]